uniref:Uncharacterized protein n=1 Tax=Klebsiella quasipneumoniae TaxID=1463165 RepID=A0A6B7Q2K7_9ENTR|nr:hypothetical protein [Klebsiella quasipneumoniae]
MYLNRKQKGFGTVHPELKTQPGLTSKFSECRFAAWRRQQQLSTTLIVSGAVARRSRLLC